MTSEKLKNPTSRLFFQCLKFELVIVVFLSSFACARPPGFGLGGRYLDAKQELVNTRTGNTDKAVKLLESVALEDPLYRDTLALLGRAYYRQGRYEDAFQILKRALAANEKDEIAWIALGLTQLRMGDNKKGLESFKGGITLLSRAAKDGYQNLKDWDKRGIVRNAIQRAAFAATKGLEDKNSIIQSGELVLTRIDQEQRLGKIEEQEEQRVNY
jgi:tetratricopeptide (TPR) repeat protein